MAADKKALLRDALKLVQAGKIDKAVETYKAVIKIDARDATVHNLLGDLYAKRGKKKEAVSEYLEASGLYEKDGFGLRSIAMCQKVVNLDPSQMTVRLKLGDLYAGQKLPAEARAQYLQVAEHYDQRGDVAAALEIFRKIADLEPGNLQVRVKLAGMFEKQKFPQKAADEYVRAAKGYHAAQETGTAAELYAQAFKLHPENAEARRWLVEHHAGLRDWPVVVELLEGPVAQGLGDPRLLLLYAEAAVGVSRPRDAVKVLERLREREPDSLPVNLALGRAHLACGEIGEGILALGRCVDAHLAGNRMETAVSLLREMAEAAPDDESILRRILEVDPKDAVAADRLRHLAPEPPPAPAPSEPASPAPSVPESVHPAETGPNDDALAAVFPTEEEEELVFEIEDDEALDLDLAAGEPHVERIADESGTGGQDVDDRRLENAAEPVPFETEAWVGRVEKTGALADSGAVGGAESQPEPAMPERVQEPGVAPEPLPETGREPGEMFELLPEPASPQPEEGPGPELESGLDTAPATEFESGVEPETVPGFEGEPEPGVGLSPTPGAAPPDEGTAATVEEPFEPALDDGSAFASELGSPLEPVAAAPPAGEEPEEPSPGVGEVPATGQESESAPGPIAAPQLPALEEFDLDEFGDTGTGAVDRGEPPAEAVELDRFSAGNDAVAASEAPVPALPSAGPAPPGENVDLSDFLGELRQEFDTQAVFPTPPQLEAGLAEIFQEFQRSVKEQLGDEDFETHYNLGIAYKEMGLLDEAIAEFELAEKSPTRRLEALSMIALCLRETSRLDEAAVKLRTAVALAAEGGEQQKGFLYDLAALQEQAGRATEARESLERLLAIDPGYRDVAARVGTAPPAAGGQRRKPPKVSYL